mmetsp:Transcript_25571/g.70613  ORF Transcript_25571/g.70613 Transcript_25571/m.70613 type:complete len:89 (+) Transcript_25571:669-935(+)
MANKINRTVRTVSIHARIRLDDDDEELVRRHKDSLVEPPPPPWCTPPDSSIIITGAPLSTSPIEHHPSSFYKYSSREVQTTPNRGYIQ